MRSLRLPTPAAARCAAPVACRRSAPPAAARAAPRPAPRPAATHAAARRLRGVRAFAVGAGAATAATRDLADRLHLLQRQMQAAVEEQDFAAAARYRDERASLLSVLPPSEQELQATLAQLRSPSADARLAAAQALGARGDPSAAPLVASALHDPDERVHVAAEKACWALWMRSGDDSVDTLMSTGMRTLEAASTPAGGEAALEAALVAFTAAAALLPEYPEAWNKRATVLYLLKRFAQSLQDCERVVALNPDHFGALSGGAMCALSLGDLAVAMKWFKAALAVNPRLEAAQKYVEMLSKAAEKLDADSDSIVEDMSIRPKEED